MDFIKIFFAVVNAIAIAVFWYFNPSPEAALVENVYTYVGLTVLLTVFLFFTNLIAGAVLWILYIAIDTYNNDRSAFWTFINISFIILLLVAGMLYDQSQVPETEVEPPTVSKAERDRNIMELNKTILCGRLNDGRENPAPTCNRYYNKPPHPKGTPMTEEQWEAEMQLVTLLAAAQLGIDPSD